MVMSLHEREERSSALIDAIGMLAAACDPLGEASVLVTWIVRITFVGGMGRHGHTYGCVTSMASTSKVDMLNVAVVRWWHIVYLASRWLVII